MLRQITFYLYFLIFLASTVASVVHFLNCDFVDVFCLFIINMWRYTFPSMEHNKWTEDPTWRTFEK